MEKLELEATKNEVLRKIGRNVLLYQQLEHVLKYLVGNGELSGAPKDLKTALEKKRQSVGKKTMGAVAGHFFENILPEEPAAEDTLDQLQGTHISLDFRIDMDSEEYESRKDALASLIADRNALIHHLIPELPTDSLEHWLEVDRLLDQQRDKILPQLDYFEKTATNLSDGRKKLAEFMLSEEGMKHIFGSASSKGSQPES